MPKPLKEQIIPQLTSPILLLNQEKVVFSDFNYRCVGCLILTQDHQILLQQRDTDCKRYPGCLATFGGGIETGESPELALKRELHEELGADVQTENIVKLALITTSDDFYSDLIYCYFWHDKFGSISGCYEGKPALYANSMAALKHPKIMQDVIWILAECGYKRIL